LLDIEVGAASLLIAMLLHFVAVASPDWLYAYRSPQRVVALTVVCTTCVLAIYGCYKLNSVRDDRGSEDSINAWLNVSLISVLAAPFLGSV
jgi:hypothetical protein